MANSSSELDAQIQQLVQKHGKEAVARSLWRVSRRRRVHDLRRSVATGLQRLGVRLETIEAVLGHIGGSRAGIVRVYQRHQFAEETREALTVWGAHLQRLLDGGNRAEVVPLRRARAIA